MPFSILDHLDKLTPTKEKGKYICPVCEGTNLSVSTETGAWNCFNDTSDQHRAEIRNKIAPLSRWERPDRPAQTYTFNYENRSGDKVVEVVRNDSSGKKQIFQNFPTIEKGSSQRKTLVEEVRAQVLPYRYKEAIEMASATKQPVFIVEGELCADKLWEIGLPAVTFLGGSGQYRTNGDYSSLFKSYRVVLCPDRDEPGVALMKEVASDNPGAQFLYADPESFEWESLPSKGGYDVGDWIDEGATQELILQSIVTKDRHEGADGLPSYEEIIQNLEQMVGLYANDTRSSFEAQKWLNRHSIKMPQPTVDKLLAEAKARIHGKEELQVLDAKAIALSEDARKWTIAGILPESSVMLLAAAPGSGKSTLLYNWALHVATGKSWSNRRCKKGTAVIIQCDEPVVDAAEKLQIIGYGEDALDYGRVKLIERWRFENIPQLLDLVKRERPQIVMIDSLTACLAGMDVDLVRSDAGNCIYELRDIANTYGCSIVILHHLNKSGGIRDSSSFEANVSEVVKLYRQEQNGNSDQFIFEWTKSRSGLAGKHFLTRSEGSYGWNYDGPIDGGRQDLDKLVNALNNRVFERFDKYKARSAVNPPLSSAQAGKLLEQARRQGLIDCSWEVGPNDTRTRMYHSWDYQEPDFGNFDDNEPEHPDVKNEPDVIVSIDDCLF